MTGAGSKKRGGKVHALIILSLSVLIILSFPSFAAYEQSLNVEKLRDIAVPIHLVELALAAFICYMALKFFSFTQPTSLFLYVYIASGCLIISSLVFFVLYFAPTFGANVSFPVVFITSRVALIGMLTSLAWMFWSAHRAMRSEKK